MEKNIHFSSKTGEWETPQMFFDNLNEEFEFNLDPCATSENAKCKVFFSKEDNGLKKSWKGKRVFMNPPYGREIGDWIKKAAERESQSLLLLFFLHGPIQNGFINTFIKKRRSDFLKAVLSLVDRKTLPHFQVC
jgi:phage N-6-adenine-methyltransferase